MPQLISNLDDTSVEFLADREARDLDRDVQGPNPNGYEPLVMPSQLGQGVAPAQRLMRREAEQMYDEAETYGFCFPGDSQG
ncbi:MAG: hypothetical protein ABH864_05525 [archaeon]